MADLRSQPQPLAYSIRGAAEATGISASLFEVLIARGDLTPRWVNSKRVLPAAELLAWIDGLPCDKPEAVSAGVA